MKFGRGFSLFTIFCTFSIIGCAVKTNKIQCGQTISAISQPEIEYIDKTFTLKWFKAPTESIYFGDVKPVTASYIFLGSKYYGQAYTIVGKDNISAVLEYFSKKVKEFYKDDAESNPFAHPTSKGHFWFFFQPEKVIILKRYTVHTAQLEVLCRDRWEQLGYKNIIEIK